MLSIFKKIPWRFLPLGALFLILPFIVHLTTFRLDAESSAAMLTTIHKDWFFYYKSLVFIGITVWMLITVLCIGRKVQIDRSHPFNVYYSCGIIFILMTTLSAYLATFENCAIVGGVTRFEGLGVIICYIMVMFYTMILIDQPKYFKWAIVCFGILVALQTFIGFFQYIGYDPLHWIGIRELVAPGDFAQTYYSADGKEPWFLTTQPGFMQGTLGNRNYTGSLVSLAMPFFAALMLLSRKTKQRVLYGLLTLCTCFMIVASASRAGMIGVCVSFVAGIILFSKAFPTVLAWLKTVFKTHRLAAWITGTACSLVLIITLVFLGLSGQLTRLITDAGVLLGLTPQPTQSLSNTSSNSTSPPNGFDFDTNTITLHTESGDSLIVHLEKGGLTFMTAKGTPVDFSSQDQITFILKDAPFESYLFEMQQQEGKTYLRFGIDAIGVCGFIIDASGNVTPTNHWDFMPITIEVAPSIGFTDKERIGSGRGYIWSRTFPMLKETLLVGNGPDTFMLEFPQNDFWAKFKTYSNGFMCVDKPHNTYLQIWTNQGLLALLSFMGIMLTYILHSFRLYGFKSKYTALDTLGIALLLSIIGYLGASFFNDTTLSVTPLFWALLGLGIAYNQFYKKHV
ncbi:MAG: O-antigen ligase family protein [Cellulosilyticaceae bacterium]